MSKRNSHTNKALRRAARFVRHRGAPATSGQVVRKEKNKYAKFFR